MSKAQEIIKWVDDVLNGAGLSRQEQDGLYQLRGLVQYVESVEDRVERVIKSAKSSDSAHIAVRVDYLLKSYIEFTLQFYNSFAQSLRAETDLPARQKSYQQGQALLTLYREWDVIDKLAASIDIPKARILDVLLTVAAPNEKFMQAYYQHQSEPLTADTTLTYGDLLPNLQRFWPADWLEDYGIDKAALGKLNNSPFESMPAGSRLDPAEFGTLYSDDPNFRDSIGTIDEQLNIDLQSAQSQTIQIIPYYSDLYGAVFFKYAPQIVGISIPAFRLSTPWDWGIVWHEVATFVARNYRHLFPIEWDALVDSFALPDLRMIYTLGNPSKWPDDIDPEDWIEEILEDGYSILSLGPSTLPTLERVLQQYYLDDYELADHRHPPVMMRLDMARLLLQKMGFALEVSATAEQEERMASLEPFATALHGRLQEVVVQVFDQDSWNDAVQAEKNIDETLTTLTDLRHLVILSQRLWLNDYLNINTDLVKKLLAALSSTDSPPAVPLEPMPNGLFTKMFKDKNWSELISSVYHTTDFVRARHHNWATHDGAVGGVVDAYYWDRDGTKHTHRHSH